MRLLLLRWFKFNAVGAVGIAVQLAALALFKSGLGSPLEYATSAAVEVAVLHNFFWHERWTWGARTQASRSQRSESTGSIDTFGSSRSGVVAPI